ncbi:MAG: hypothetical protein SFU25_08555 [Candidatus Caenarcaniphilales bacterium]|nr:hypothetical protein [Candidatus Caenarcaniphilales bacterium]
MLLKKLTIYFSLICLLMGFAPSQQPTKADPLTLGIIGTALGGTALGLGIWNRASIWRRDRMYGYGGWGGGYVGGMPYYGGGGYYGGAMPTGCCGGMATQTCYQPVTSYVPVTNYVPVTYSYPVQVAAPPACCGAPIGCGSYNYPYGLFR